MARLSVMSVGKLEELIVAEAPATDGRGTAGEEGAGGGRAFLQELKEDPGAVQLDTLTRIPAPPAVCAIALRARNPVHAAASRFTHCGPEAHAGWRQTSFR